MRKFSTSNQNQLVAAVLLRHMPLLLAIILVLPNPATAAAG